MKTVTGKITDSTPVSISKAASILSKFVSSENGASQALNAYLRRATAAFDELSRLHSKSDRRKHKKDSSLIRSLGLVLRVFLGRFGLTLTAVAPNLHLAGQLSEPANVMSLPAWAVHVSCLVEW
ncbi:hypothetical protein POTOM_058511 [Populus tomentosa]|uniref:Uncharacterized protein n=1 Tax=Populus tomentosa TaxID=118781 RepID=A0A8X7XYZ0_POPTO|nr:hypothetical protein POTOM_058511 [Populus tomentosa]